MQEMYDLATLLDDMLKDEESDVHEHRIISQDEIRKLLLETIHHNACMGGSASGPPLGESLVHEKLITEEQLFTALKMQSENGGRIGSILVSMGCITERQLLRFLEKKHGIEAATLVGLNINDSALSLLPTRIMLKYKVLPIEVGESAIRLGMENPNDLSAIHTVEFFTSKRVIPVIVPAYQMSVASRFIEEKKAGVFQGADFQNALKESTTIQTLLEWLAEVKGTDLLISAGLPPMVKGNRQFLRFSMPPLTPEQCSAYAKSLMSDLQWEDFLKRKDLHFAATFEGVGRFRVNAYRQKDTVSLAVRRISSEISSLEALGLPAELEEYVLKPHGLILVAAPIGHGKTTTMAAMVDLINRRRACNIITLEDPIEYLHEPKCSVISQREVGKDISSLSEGLRRVFKQAPDVIVIGEMSDRESFEIALACASTGHLVLGAMHSSNATSALETIIARHPPHLQCQARKQLADSLVLVLSQRLLPGLGDGAMALAHERLAGSTRVKSCIREDRIHQIRTQIQPEAEDFSSMDISLIRLLSEERISLDSALIHAESPDFAKRLGKDKA
ncbi:MAG: PilT/PilU family type 4a pilus ATPase [Acidobacteriota bacterium]